MFKNLHSLVYTVDEIQKARDWYARVLDKEPISETPFSLIFEIGGINLYLNLRRKDINGTNTNFIGYWSVDDIESVYQKLIEFGAIKHTDISENYEENYIIRTAAVYDPFGNIIGIYEQKGAKGVEEKPSVTAMGAAFCRAIHCFEKIDGIPGPDNIAKIFLPLDWLTVFENLDVLQWIKENKLAKGIVEYHSARTIFFDQIFTKALNENCPQIVILGAGFDSRAYRFKDNIQETRIYELDIHTTQRYKIECLIKSNVDIPEQVTFVPINFAIESIEDRLSKAGFDNGKKTTFLLEGLIQYLSEGAVNAIFNAIKSISKPGSFVVFNYIIDSERLRDGYGVKEQIESINSTGEPYKFKIKEGEINFFLEERGLQLIGHHSAEELAKDFLIKKDGSIGGKITAFFGMAQAVVI
ncbi:MAG: SAM-dependent methyltransferase [Spirochaetota bacterium]|nr:SAM-dependent methyltransferase [Spirochaetota bacterium]